MPVSGTPSDNIPLADGRLDARTAALVRLSAWITGGTEQEVRDGLDACQAAGVPDRWVEELVLQSYLFAGFPRALNAAREWRAKGAGTGGGAAGRATDGPGEDATPVVRDGAGWDGAVAAAAVARWHAAGEETCARVYGRHYEKLRRNIRALHPELDDWMIVEGYGKVLSRMGLDLGRRELCIVAACAAARQARQLHSHLHGARNVGVPDAAIAATLVALEGAVPADALAHAQLLWRRVR
ncbi:MAG: carboxymuconolactone decarboxylase family protein [Gemmatimonadota bacterium]|nr:carboxymuconolactone decarboxylase family protein [Gemmatimonadota bacterium]